MVFVDENKCNHQWIKSGLWDGKDPDTGAKTGGVLFRCKLCGKRVTSIEEAEALGGLFDENVDAMGQSVKKTM